MIFTSEFAKFGRLCLCLMQFSQARPGQSYEIYIVILLTRGHCFYGNFLDKILELSENVMFRDLIL